MKKKIGIILLIIVILLIIGLVVWGNLKNKETDTKENNPSSITQGESPKETPILGPSKVKKLTMNLYEEEVQKSEKVVVIEFGASWCADCKVQEPIVDRLSAEQEDVSFLKVDIDEETELKDLFGINALPALAVVKEGKVTKKVVGVVNRQKILDLIDQ